MVSVNTRRCGLGVQPSVRHRLFQATRPYSEHMSPKTTPRQRLAAIVCAAGSGTRFGNQHGSKLDADLHGTPVVIRAVKALARHAEIVTIIVAGPAEEHALKTFRDHYEDQIQQLGAKICAGGQQERYETVQAALEYLLSQASEHGSEWGGVLVHDAARPCVSMEVTTSVIEALTTHAAVVPAVPIADTLRRSRSGAEPRVADGSVDRHGLFACQTPQGFRLDVIRRAYTQTDLASTDDAQLVERLGERIMLVPGDPRNIKITRPHDLEFARAIWPTLHTSDRD